jgi:hypothetical protein
MLDEDTGMATGVRISSKPSAAKAVDDELTPDDFAGIEEVQLGVLGARCREHFDWVMDANHR